MFDYRIGIDFSINSPAICIYNTKKESYQFISFFNDGGRDAEKAIPAGTGLYEKLTENGVSLVRFSRSKPNSDYSLDQITKIKEAFEVSQAILAKLPKEGSIIYGLEGFSYGSKGNSFIDLIIFNSILRHAIYSNLKEGDDFRVLSPSQVKKKAGKGNANKLDMLNFFLRSGDPILLREDFWVFSNSQSSSLIQKGKIVKPIDDLVDAYFICNALLEY